MQVKNAGNLQQAQVVQQVPQSAFPMNQTTQSELQSKTDQNRLQHQINK